MKKYNNYTVPFRSGFGITQYFANNPLYYNQFGLAGHEGLDLIPLDNDFSLYAIESGIVLRDNDIPRNGGAYGNYIVIWNAQKRRAWWYCHMAVNYIFYGQRVSYGERIGLMGATGNTSGAHLHLGLRYGDANGYPINLGNGYQGYVDPLPVLLEVGSGNKGETSNTQAKTHPYNTDQNPYRDNKDEQDEDMSDNTTHPYNTDQNPYKKSHPYNTNQNAYRKQYS